MEFNQANDLLNPGYLPFESGYKDRRFWLGLIESRDPKVSFTADQIRAMRQSNVNEELARRLHQHATEEMGYLAEILPTLYRRMTQDDTF